MSITRPRSARALLLFAVTLVIVAGLPAAGAVASTGPVPQAAGKVVDRADGIVRVVVHGGNTDGFLRGLGGVSDFKLVYRYDIIRGVAVAVPAARVDRVIEFARAQGLKAERDMEIKADLPNSARTVHVKANGQDAGAWSLGYTGAGVTIAVVDSGIYAQHTSLDDVDDNGSTTDPKVVKFKDYVNAGGNEVAPYDDNDHGSHVSGIAAGTGGGSQNIGMAFRANLAGFKVFGAEGTGSSADFIAALNWIVSNPGAVNPPIRVVNYSGGSVPVGGNNNGNSAQSLAIDAASDAGIVVAAAGGNGSQDGAGPNSVDGNVGIPGDARKAIAVCSSDSSNPPAAPAYSDWDSEGPTGDGRIKPDVCAPGDSVSSVNSPSNGGLPCPPPLICGGPSAYAAFGGTSMSTPHVSGIVALIIQAVPAITPAQVREVIYETAREYPSKNNDRGYGEINAKRAIELAISRYGGPPPALSVLANGPYNVAQGETASLSATAIGGTPGYTFAWDLDNNGSFETAGKTVTFSDTASIGTKTMQVRVVDSDSTPATAVDSAAVNVLAKVTLLSDNVEGGDNGWVSSDTTTGWHRTTIRSQSPDESWYPGNDVAEQYLPLTSATLTRPVDLSTGPAASSGQILFRFSRSGDLEEGFDRLRAQIKKTADAVWTTLGEFDDTLGTTWTTNTFDITSFRGFPVEVRFEFTSDELFEFTGPFIDDIQIFGTSPPAVDSILPDPIDDLGASGATETTVTLTWTATGDDGAVGKAASYDLRRDTSPISAATFGAATQVSGLPSPKPSGDAESFVVTGLTPDTTYFFAIKAADEAANLSAISNPVSIPTLPDITAPSKVLGLAGSAGNATVNLSWSAATDNVGVTAYEVQQDGNVAVTTPETSATLTGLTNGVTYEFRVRARDAAGNFGALSDPLSLTPIEPPTIGGWPQSRGGSSRTGFTAGSGSIAFPAIRQTLTMAQTVTSSPLIVDLDGDGDMDVVAVENMTSPAALIVVRAFKQEPSGLLAPAWSYTVPPIALDPSAPPTPTNGFGNLAVGDLNGDGSPEVAVYTNYITNLGGATLNDGQLRILRSDGTLGGALDLVIAVNSAPAIGDVTGDGIPEVVFVDQIGGAPPGGGYFVSGASYDGAGVSITFATSTGTASVLTPPALVEARPGHPGLEVLVAQNAAPQNLFLCSPGGGAAGCSESIGLGVAARGIAARDLDGDSVPEAIVNADTGQSLQIVRLGTPLTKVSFADGFLRNTASAADVDGDGLAEIVNINYSEFVDDTAKAGDVRVRGFNGSAYAVQGTLPRPPAPGQSSQSLGGGALVNIAGDARPEMVFGTDDSKLVAVAFAAGTGVPSPLWNLTLPAAAKAPPAIGDVTGDGRLDIVVATTDGRLTVVGAGPPASLSISPPTASIVAGESQTYTAIEFDAAGNPLDDVTSTTTFSITPNGSCTDNVCTATTAGPHTITGTRGAFSGTATLTVTAGPLDHLVLTPATAIITAGGSQAYTAEGFDQFNNSRGDVTASTVFTIAPNGSCSTSAVCTATASGAHTVTGTNGTVTGTATLTVTAGPLDHLVLTPSASTIALGQSQLYTSQGRDQFGNSLGDMTGATVFTIAPTGSCTANSCTDTIPGSRTVTGRAGTVTGTAALNIVNSIHHLVLSPSTATVTAGGSQAYTATAYDSNNVSLGNVTTNTVFTISPDGQCTANVCQVARAGAHVVTGNNNGATGTASLMVNPGPLTQLIITPGFATTTPGVTRTYQASGRDAFGNHLGDLTSSTTFSIAPDGSCSGNACGATLTGSHTVTGTSSGVTGTATLQVNPVRPVILTPAQGAVTTKNVTVSGTAPVSSTVRLTDNGIQIAENISVDSGGAWSIALEFAGGTHNLVARAVIGTSFSDPSETRMFTVDATPPTVSISRPSGYVVAHIVLPGEQVEISGTASDLGIGIDRVEISYEPILVGSSVTSTLTCTGLCASFAWTDTPALDLGFYTVTAVAYDRAGGASAPSTINLIVLDPGL